MAKLKGGAFRVRLNNTLAARPRLEPARRFLDATLTTPGSTPEQGLAGGTQEPSPEQLRAKVAALADQVRALANGRHPALGAAPAPTPADPSAAPRTREEEGVADEQTPRAFAPETLARGEQPGSDKADAVAGVEPARVPAEEAAAAEEFAYLSGRLLEAVIDTAELAAAEIRASAEREAADIRERADAAIGEADAALARYREALAALSVETERIELSVAALREQAQALEEERGRVDAAIEVLRRRPAR